MPNALRRGPVPPIPAVVTAFKKSQPILRAVTLAGLSVVAALAVTKSDAQAQSATYTGRWFSPSSAWNTPIGSASVTNYSSSAIQAYLANKSIFSYNMDLWTAAVIYSDGVTDPAVDLPYSWGPTANFIFKQVPLNPNLLAYAKWLNTQTWPPGGVGTRLDGDGRVCMYNEAMKGFYSFWATNVNSTGDSVTVKAGGFSTAAGPGGNAAGTAAKQSYCAGLIRTSEWASGQINHALSVVWPVSLVLSSGSPGSYVYPALATDGSGTNPATAVPMGARLQLNPNLTDTQLKGMGLNSLDLIIAHALQTYGGYVVDTGPGTTSGIYFQNAFGKGQSVYGIFGQGTPGYATPTHMQTALYSQFRFVAPPSSQMPMENLPIPKFCGSATTC